MSGAMNRRCIRINYVHSARRGTSLQECPGIIKTMHRVACTRIALYQRPGADTRETGRYDLAWKDLCSVLNALSK